MKIANNCCFAWVNNLEHFCKDYLFCQTSSYLVYSDYILKSCIDLALFNWLRDLSYFTIIIPVLVVLIFIVLQLFSILSKTIGCFLKKTLSLCMDFPPVIKPTYKEITLTPEQKEILVNSLKKEPSSRFEYLRGNDLNLKEGDIEWLSEHGVFRHRSIPGLIFRTPIGSFCPDDLFHQEVENMFNFAKRCWLTCKKKNLDLLEVPRVGMENLSFIDREDRCILIIEELEFKSGMEAQFLLRKQLSQNSKTYPLLERLEEQVIEFIFATMYEDVKYDNFPILNRKSNEEPIKAAVIDFDGYKPIMVNALWGVGDRRVSCRRGVNLFTMLETKKAIKKAYCCASSIRSSRCSFEIKKDIKKLFEFSKELWNFQNKQEKFHIEKNIVTGKELLDVNAITKEDFRYTLEPEVGFETAKDILKQLNEEISKSDFINKICIRQINLKEGCGEIRKAFDICYNGRVVYKTLNEMFLDSLLNQVCQILVEKELISSFKCVHPTIRFWF